MKALFIGRFQPFHKGHLKIIKHFENKYDKIIIGVGSAQYSNTFKNPFSYEERKEMIKLCLDTVNIKNYKIIKIPDIHNPPKWVDYLLGIYSDFDAVITNSDFIKDLFLEKNIEVVKSEFVITASKSEYIPSK
jgi:nicotinamide-nucleotide adenylyltransferase